jgi:glycosyltransferase involved in cell wall biosynthesis
MERVLFYSSVLDTRLFNTQYFYKADIQILKDLGYDVKVTNKILDFLSFKKYDIAFLYFYRYSFFAAFIARLYRKKIYFTGGIDDLEKSNVTNKQYFKQMFFFNFCYILSTNCIMVSNSDMINAIKSLKFVNTNKLVLSFHTIEIDKYIIKENIFRKNNFVTISWMGSIDNVKRKGVDLAIIIFSELIKKTKYFDSKLIIIGKEGEGKGYLLKIVEELGLINNVVFLGEVEEDVKISILSENKFYFQLSKYEGFGIAALEALIMGNIVIHSGKGGLRDSVSDFGIQIDINKNIENIVSDVLYNIETFNFLKIIEARKYVFKDFTSAKRQNDFKKFLKSNM